MKTYKMLIILFHFVFVLVFITTNINSGRSQIKKNYNNIINIKSDNKNLEELNELNKDRNNVFSNTDSDYDTNNGNNNNINNNINHNSNNVATTTRDYTKQPQSHNSNLPTTKQKNVKNKQELIRNICFNVCLNQTQESCKPKKNCSQMEFCRVGCNTDEHSSFNCHEACTRFGASSEKLSKCIEVCSRGRQTMLRIPVERLELNVDSITSSSARIVIKDPNKHSSNSYDLAVWVLRPEERLLYKNDRSAHFNGLKEYSHFVSNLKPASEYKVQASILSSYFTDLISEYRFQTPSIKTELSSKWIVGRNNELVVLDSSNVLDTNKRVLYGHEISSVLVAGLDINYEEGLVYVAYSNEDFIVVDYSSGGKKMMIKNFATLISYDWINKKLYRALGSRVYTCQVENLPECDLPVDLTVDRASHLKVDPLNNLIFWIKDGYLKTKELSNNNPDEKIYEQNHPITTFTLNVIDMMIYFPFNNSIQSICYGRNENDSRTIRSGNRFESSNYEMVTLIHNKNTDAFVWSNGSTLIYEEYNEQAGSHKMHDILDGIFISQLSVWDVVSQPTPVPGEAPSDVNVWCHKNSVSINWNVFTEIEGTKITPRLWWYEIKIVSRNMTSELMQSNNDDISKVDSRSDKYGSVECEEEDDDDAVDPRMIISIYSNDFFVTVHNLTSMVYCLKIRAIFRETYGLWSPMYSYVPWQSVPVFLTSDGRSLYELQEGESSKLFVDNLNDIKFISSSRNVVTVHSAKDTILIDLCSNKTEHWPTSSPIDASHLLYDRYSHSLYWINSQADAIFRSSLFERSSQEIVYTNSKSQLDLGDAVRISKIVLDVQNGFIYWYSNFKIEASQLNGKCHKIIKTVEDLSNERIAGIILDPSKNILISFVSSGNKTSVHTQPLYRYKTADCDDNELSRAEDVQDRESEVAHFYGFYISGDLMLHEGSVLWLSSGASNQQPQAAQDGQQQHHHMLCSFNLNTRRLSWNSWTYNHSFNFLSIKQKNCEQSSTSYVVMSTNINLTLNASTLTWFLLDSSIVPDVQLTFKVHIVSMHHDHRIVTNNATSYKMENIDGVIKAGVSVCTLWGCGDVKWTNVPTFMTSTEEMTERREPYIDNDKLLTIFIVLFLILITAFSILAYTFYKRKTKQTSGGRTFLPLNSVNLELVSLTNPPNPSIQVNNVLYSYAHSLPFKQEELSTLPHIPRNLLHLKKFIGSGAFGKVYEGVITGDNMTALDVAIKTLHLQASDIEKREFLKEALLMNRFRHEKLLHLIGVCFDDECNFIVIELMREKDLLTFLRKEKSSEQPNVSLSTMLSICQDVAEGCEYLQGMRFVHRDLAARNCLVSYDNAGKLIVKIGDFGLARDVYINDYYKKEGEGLLPVRWMAPESLVDGIFTTYSDIWSFGVLIWEVLSLGNQPYLAQSNLEVLQYVRSGGILDRPPKCPDQLYNLMVRCWAYQPDKRPCFHTIVKLIKHVSHQMIHNRDYVTYNYNCEEPSPWSYVPIICDNNNELLSSSCYSDRTTDTMLESNMDTSLNESHPNNICNTHSISNINNVNDIITNINNINTNDHHANNRNNVYNNNDPSIMINANRQNVNSDSFNLNRNLNNCSFDTYLQFTGLTDTTV